MNKKIFLIILATMGLSLPIFAMEGTRCTPESQMDALKFAIKTFANKKALTSPLKNNLKAAQFLFITVEACKIVMKERLELTAAQIGYNFKSLDSEERHPAWCAVVENYKDAEHKKAIADIQHMQNDFPRIWSAAIWEAKRNIDKLIEFVEGGFYADLYDGIELQPDAKLNELARSICVAAHWYAYRTLVNNAPTLFDAVYKSIEDSFQKYEADPTAHERLEKIIFDQDRSEQIKYLEIHALKEEVLRLFLLAKTYKIGVVKDLPDELIRFIIVLAWLY